MTHRPIATLLLLACTIPVAAAEPPRGIEAMTVPPGFAVELVAGPPLVERPMLAAFDDEGRLYVCDSAGVNLRGPELSKNPPHKIRLLEDTDGDGRFDTSKVFAAGMVFPQGIAWHDGAVFCSSPPSFWRLEDTDGDGTADKREELVTGFANTGVADDMHGGSLGPDGRLYWCAGRFPHEIHRPGGEVIHKGTAPLILRCLPDGSELEVVCGSQGNAVGVAFSRAGDMFASGTFLAPNSMGAGLRDALVHLVDGGEYPVRDRTLNEHKRTGDLLPPLTHLGVSASADLMLCRSTTLGEAYQGNLFSALFNMHKIVRHKLESRGASFTCSNEDFLVSADPDFHPTDVFEDADGSLLVVDTGGWFRIGCPTSQVSKPDVLGGIYRVRRVDAETPDDPRGRRIAWDSLDADNLCKMLADGRFAVRDRALARLAKLGAPAVPAIERVFSGSADDETKCVAVWALARIDGDAARAATRNVLDDASPSVRQAAARACGLHRDAAAGGRLAELVKSDAPGVRREAATALGRIGDRAAVPNLLDALSTVGDDRFLEHAIVFALIALDDRPGTARGLAAADSHVKRGALIALDQMDDGRLEPDVVTPFLNPADPLLQQTALWVIAHHGNWGGSMLDFFRGWLVRDELDDARRDTLRHQLLAFAANPGVQDLVAAALRDTQTSAATRLVLLEVIGQASDGKLPDCWADALEQCLDDRDERIVQASIAALRALPPDERPVMARVDGLLSRLVLDESRPIDLRVQAAAAVTGRLASLEPELFEFLRGGLSQSNGPLVRLDAAEALARARLDEAQLVALCGTLAECGPLEVPRLVRAFEQSTSEEVGRQLVAALGHSPGLKSLPGETLAALVARYPESVRREAEPLIAASTLDAAAQKARLAALEDVLSSGEIQRGRDLFFGNKKAICATCHTVQGQGGKIGPDLSKIGAIRTPRDLVEAIVLPSASFARGYEPFTLATDDGRVTSGVIVRETADAVHVFTTERVEVRVPRASIETLKASTVSIMPAGMDEQLSRQELADLIAFLQSLR